MITDIDPAANAFWIANGMESKRYEYDLTPEDTVIDLGAFQGEFATLIHERYGCPVICVEPTAAANHLERFDWATVINKAVSIDDMPMKFGGNSYYTTVMEPGNQIYPCFDILELFFQEIGLLKINIEGCEWAIMARIIDHGVQHYVKNFQIQFHKISENSDSAYEYLSSILRVTHTLEWRVPYVWESWKRR